MPTSVPTYTPPPPPKNTSPDPKPESSPADETFDTSG